MTEGTTCLQPTSSVLFDGHIPTLTGLDGDMWASQLLTIQTTARSTPNPNVFVANVIFEFSVTETPVYRVVEVVMFNCPQWGIGTTRIALTDAIAMNQTYFHLNSTEITSSLTSCESLVRVCLSARVSRPVIRLQFILDWDSDWVHLAEVTFYTRGSTCPPNVILNPPTTLPPTTPTTPSPDITPYTLLPTLATVSSDKISSGTIIMIIW